MIQPEISRPHFHAAAHYATAKFALCSPDLYAAESLTDFAELQSLCAQLPIDPLPGRRRRAMSRFLFHADGTVVPMGASTYQQDYAGEALGPRELLPISDEILRLRSFQEIFQVQATLAQTCHPDLFGAPVRCTVHLVTYCPAGLHASFSHPVAGHVDREDHVGLVCLGSSDNLSGGANYLYAPGMRTPSVQLVLGTLESILLGPGCMHGVSPMSSSNHLPAMRRIGLFTFEAATGPRKAQYEAAQVGQPAA